MINENNIPQHIAIIMDGNGRWAQEKRLPRTAGYRIGVSRVKEIISSASDLGIKVITFFAFSSENWQRPEREIAVLMRHLDYFLSRQIKELERKGMKVKFIGRGDPLPVYFQKKIKEAEARTKDNTGLVVVFALNYGSRQEIVDATKKFAHAVVKGETKIDSLTTDSFSSYFYTADLPDPDLLIRTSGEMRLSNFLLWQLSYAELYFPEKYWPDFRRPDLEEAIRVYQSRERRFGRI